MILHSDVRSSWWRRLVCWAIGHTWQPWYHPDTGGRVRDHCMRCDRYRDPS